MDTSMNYVYAYIAFRRPINEGNVEVLFREDWGSLKMEMVKKWDVEHGFDSNHAWPHLEQGDTVMYDGCLHSVIQLNDDGQRIGYEAFGGRLIHYMTDGEQKDAIK